jgi:hypothetical protein
MTPDKIGTQSVRVVQVTPAALVTIEQQAFVKTDWYPLDVITLIAGRAGEGKSTLTLADVAAATCGTLSGDYVGQRLTVALTATEDTKSMQTARLRAAGADLDRVMFLDIANLVAGEPLESVPRIPEDLDQIRETLIDVDARLWIIDPLTALVAGDTNRRDDVRAALDPLHALARKLHIAVVGILHFGKGAGYASDKISGSHAFRDVARSVLLVAHDDDTGEHVVTLDKSNYAEAVGTSWAFQLTDTPVTGADGKVQHVPRITGMTETDTDVNTIINREIVPAEVEDRTEAERYLEDFLTQQGKVASKGVKQAARKVGISDRTIKRAANRLGVLSESVGFPRVTYWSLPDASRASEATPDHALRDVAQLAQLEGSAQTSQSQDGSTGANSQLGHAREYGPTGPDGQVVHVPATSKSNLHPADRELSNGPR